ncbi:MAG: DUF2851 family protein [Eudoraea sp.]|nr:DUF2851 family protein [Eudoraea sp.]
MNPVCSGISYFTAMREDVLQFIWGKNKGLQKGLTTTNNSPITIVTPGVLNRMAGPDFYNAHIIIDGQEWFGTVEVHVRSSDWYRHKHGIDPNYKNVILHVVWEDDAPVKDHLGTNIPTLQLKGYIPQSELKKYKRFHTTENSRFINCEKDLYIVPKEIKGKWLAVMQHQRLHEKSIFINELLQSKKNDWEYVFFVLLLKSVGLNHNGNAFMSLAKAIDFSIIRKIGRNSFQIESLFFGLSGLLGEERPAEPYYLKLKKEYRYLKTKFQLNELAVIKPEFFKLRPFNFPTIRLSQVASLYGRNANLFQDLIAQNKLEGLYNILQVKASDYWDTHFNFGKITSFKPKKMSSTFQDLLIINAVLPMKYTYNVYKGIDVSETIREIGAKMTVEKNELIRNFKTAGIAINSANGSQALLQLYKNYCTRNKCLQCSLGSYLLSGK